MYTGKERKMFFIFCSYSPMGFTEQLASMNEFYFHSSCHSLPYPLKAFTVLLQWHNPREIDFCFCHNCHRVPPSPNFASLQVYHSYSTASSTSCLLQSFFPFFISAPRWYPDLLTENVVVISIAAMESSNNQKRDFSLQNN